MQVLDFIVIGLFAIALIGIIVWVLKQKQDNSADYFLGGRDATWIAIGASIFASNIGSEHLIGLAGAGASSGMAMAHWEIQGWMILILGWVFVPFYSRSMVYTMPEFLERRYNPQSRTILSVISLVSYVLTKVAVTVYAGGLVFQQVFGIQELWGIDFFWIAAIGLVLLTAVYTIVGGMKSVLYTSVLQTPILLLGSIVILVLGLKELGGWDEMIRICGGVSVNEYGDTMTNLIRSNRDPNFPWLGALIGSSIIGFWYWCTDQYIVQRVLSGKNEQQARRGTIFGAYLKLLPVFLFLIPGMIAFALHQKNLADGGFLPLLSNGMHNADAAFPTLVAKLLPAGMKGLVVCGILAALMSSLASLFNSSAMLFTIDFYKRFKPETPEKKLVNIGQMATVIIVILGILWIPIMRSIGDVLYAYLQDVQSVLSPGIAAAFLLGITWKRTSAQGGMWGLISGMAIGLVRLGANVYYSNVTDAADSLFKTVFYDTNWLFFCGWMFLACILVVVLVSLFTKAPSAEKIQGLVFGTATPEQRAATRASWNHWDVIHSIIIIGITLSFYLYFW
ncbi:SSS family solute:Na+ symporter [Parabacteroides sp. PF5-5]|uniref:sodium:solute symporter n=1 Tax=unclassified Parabacteroides TaxID=2649774 RepID=UPI00247669A2|nr:MULTISPECIES: sodium:solute symporter [unclassified Parabacteroides]MDH6306129.1 SSS family solute:Na+ symporter [Parabacteroides sp. PH5-39]MDH6317088.1 SSS family solute:Na+ symporter [Parabacteroides sp. PF5-13]MDH6320841.1 SSS family solute:Na+ symporter [Parabacteroides sp. PH5-13]MDH6324572.1 SSS family solute:Na+ symporter [Parabacteroides sp. PH5-8]MDH6328377.1 SSS family solute:Na+ symporter [Parabacteroides sp. PH5-41]